MQTLTIGAYRATLAPTRDVGAFQAKLAKCNGKSRRLPLRDLRTKSGFPVFTPGMSTAEYVKAYSSGDGTQLKAWEWAQLNDAPCTLYSGEDTCETLPDGFDTWEDFDAAQGSNTAAESAPADAEPVDAAEPVAPDDAIAPAIVASAEPYPGCEPAAAIVYRVHLATAAHSRAIDPTFSGMLRRPRSAGFMDDFMAPEVRVHRNAIAAMVRACRAKRTSVPLPADTGPLTTDTGADLGEQSAHRIGRESFERGEAMMSDASLRRAFGSQAERDAYYRGYDDAERAARPAPATHSEPAPARPVYANDHLAWADVERDRSDPDEYQARLIECFGEVKAGGLFYNSDTYPATAALMTARYGYPDWRGDRGQSDGVANPFGMDCYRADSVIRARAERERERGAAATFTVGQRFARLIFNDGKQRTAAELVTLDPAGFTCKLKAKSGRNSVEVTCSAYALSLAVIRAEERGKVLAAKRASARPAPIALEPAEPAPVPSKSEREDSMLQHVLGALQRIAPDGIPDSAMLAREADRIEATAERMRDAMPDYSATCATVAHDLHALADSTIDPLPGKSDPEALDDDETIPAPLDGLDVAELDDMVEFERAGGATSDPPATHSALVAEINAMSPVDAFDYLADYTTARERHMTDAEKAPDAMRAAVLADVERTGEAVFWARRRGEPDDDGPTASPPATHSDRPPPPDYRNTWHVSYRTSDAIRQVRIRAAGRADAMAYASALPDCIAPMCANADDDGPSYAFSFANPRALIPGRFGMRGIARAASAMRCA